MVQSWVIETQDKQAFILVNKYLVKDVQKATGLLDGPLGFLGRLEYFAGRAGVGSDDQSGENEYLRFQDSRWLRAVVLDGISEYTCAEMD